MRSNWLYLAIRSLRLAEPVLICPVHKRDGQVGNRAVFGFTAAVTGHRRVAVTSCQLDRINGLGKRTDLIDFDQNAIRNSFVDSFLQPRHVGYEQIVANKLNPIADFFSELFPGIPIVFIAPVFDAANRVLLTPVGQEVNHFVAGQAVCRRSSTLPDSRS